eukprot:Clim_evm71s128 gene=Clim_evmTU71s128
MESRKRKRSGAHRVESIAIEAKAILSGLEDHSSKKEISIQAKRIGSGSSLQNPKRPHMDESELFYNYGPKFHKFLTELEDDLVVTSAALKARKAENNTYNKSTIGILNGSRSLKNMKLNLDTMVYSEVAEALERGSKDRLHEDMMPPIVASQLSANCSDSDDVKMSDTLLREVRRATNADHANLDEIRTLSVLLDDHIQACLIQDGQLVKEIATEGRKTSSVLVREVREQETKLMKESVDLMRAIHTIIQTYNETSGVDTKSPLALKILQRAINPVLEGVKRGNGHEDVVDVRELTSSGLSRVDNILLLRGVTETCDDDPMKQRLSLTFG